MEKYLFEQMTAAMDLKNQKELEYMIAEREYKRIQAAYLAYKKEDHKND